MTIARRLILLLAVPLAALLGLGVFVRVHLAHIEERSRFMAEAQIPSNFQKSIDPLVRFSAEPAWLFFTCTRSTGVPHTSV